jgi:hypothetical protein
MLSVSKTTSTTTTTPFNPIYVVFRQRNFQLILIAATLLCHALIYSPIFLSIDSSHKNVTYTTNKNVTHTFEKCDINSLDVIRPLSVVYLIESNVLPFCIMMGTTYAILRCLYASRRNLEKRDSIASTSSSSSRKRRDRKFGVNSVCLNVLFVLLKSPFVLSCIFPRVDYDTNERIQAVCLVFFYINHSIHFFTHLCVNSIFRHEFCELVGCTKSIDGPTTQII